MHMRVKNNPLSLTQQCFWKVWEHCWVWIRSKGVGSAHPALRPLAPPSTRAARAVPASCSLPPGAAAAPAGVSCAWHESACTWMCWQGFAGMVSGGWSECALHFLLKSVMRTNYRERKILNSSGRTLWRSEGQRCLALSWLLTIV